MAKAKKGGVFMLDNKTRGKKAYERLTANVFILAQHDVITTSGDDQRDVLQGQDTGDWDFGFKGAGA